MEQNPPKPMTPFDNLVTPPFLYTLKLLLPYTPPSIQRFFGVYIKFLELRHTMEVFQGFSSDPSPSNILEGLKPYMNPSEKEMMEQMSGMMNMMEMVQNMQNMQNMSGSSMDSSSFDPMDMMKSMMNPEQQEMFEMYSMMFENEMNQPDTGSRKGDNDNERMDEPPVNAKHGSNENGADPHSGSTDSGKEREVSRTDHDGIDHERE